MSLRTCEFIVVALLSFLWVYGFGALIFSPHLLVNSPVTWLPVLIAVALVAGWSALFIKDFARVPKAVCVFVAAGLALGLMLAAYGLVASVLAGAWSSVPVVGLVVIPCCRHLLRALRCFRKQTVAS